MISDNVIETLIKDVDKRWDFSWRRKNQIAPCNHPCDVVFARWGSSRAKLQKVEFVSTFSVWGRQRRPTVGQTLWSLIFATSHVISHEKSSRVSFDGKLYDSARMILRSPIATPCSFTSIMILNLIGIVWFEIFIIHPWAVYQDIPWKDKVYAQNTIEKNDLLYKPFRRQRARTCTITISKNLFPLAVYLERAFVTREGRYGQGWMV